MRFLGLRSHDGSEWGLSPETTIEASPFLLNDVDGVPMTLLADIEAPDFSEAAAIWLEVQRIYWDMEAAS